VLRRLSLLGLGALLFAVPATAHAATVSIFYYPWYGSPPTDGIWEHWDQNEHRPPGHVYSRFYPARGAYSSSSRRLVDAQMTDMQQAGVDEVVTSWWGRGSTTDERLPLILRSARSRGLTVAAHLEPYHGRTLASIADDIRYLVQLGIRDVYVYEARDFAAADWAALRPSLPPVRLFAHTSRVGFAAAGRFDGFYTYDFVNYGGDKFRRLCGQAHALGLLCAPAVGPGYDGVRAGEAPVGRPRLDGATYDRLWSAALAASPDVVTITSYNEWGEGTQIEPARRRPGYESYDGAWGLRGRAAERAYLDRTAFWAGRLHAAG
jgi:glycoprotein endo-alpha-1,2-mannosidase